MVQIVRGAVPADHIHMLVRVPTHMALSHLVRYPKGRSSRRPQQEFPYFREKYGGQHLGAGGSSAGAADEKTVRKSIEMQSRYAKAEGFEVTVPFVRLSHAGEYL